MLTLRWLTPEDDLRAAQHVPHRLLEEVPQLGVGDRGTGNMLIQGDYLHALKALLPFYAGQVKCLFRPAIQHALGPRELRRQP